MKYRNIFIALLTLITCVSAMQSSYASTNPIVTDSVSLKDLGQTSSLMLQGSESEAAIYFGSRSDEIVLDAEVELTYTLSPTLSAMASHIKVYLNNELMDVLPVIEGQQGTKVHQQVQLDPRFISDTNELRLQLVGVTPATCQNPNTPSIWAEISASTILQLETRKIALNSDLSLLPKPFFDEKDFSSIEYSLVVAKGLSINEVKSVGIAASYIGSYAKWREINVKVVENELPKQHSIVFATNDNRPTFLSSLPEVDGPVLQMVTHPKSSHLKMLLVLGRDSDDLLIAVNSLISNSAFLTGQTVKVNELVTLQARTAYDAPNWLPTDRKVSLSELVDHAVNLQTTGVKTQPVNVNFTLAPDLFTWQSREIALDIGYRYSAPSDNKTGANLSFSVNEQFIKDFPFTKDGAQGEENRIRIPLLDNDDLVASKFSAPALKVGERNSLKFDFSFAGPSVSNCQPAQASINKGIIDAGSTIDLTGLPHYIKMPNMKAFASSGFPYTRFADLQETVVVLETQPEIKNIQLFVDLMSQFSKQTGAATNLVTVTDNFSAQTSNNKDVIILAAQVLNESDLNKLVSQEDLQRSLFIKNQTDFDRKQAWTQQDFVATKANKFISLEASGTFASVYAFESPYTTERTVTVFNAQTIDDNNLLLSKLFESANLPYIYGSVVTVTDNNLTAYEIGDVYYNGQLPLLTLVWFQFSDNPILLALVAFILVSLLIIFVWQIIQRIAVSRIGESG